MSLRQKRQGVMTLLGAGIVLVLLGTGTHRSWLELLGLVGLLTGLVLDVTWVRCPKCGIWLGRDPGLYCPGCREEIPWDRKNPT